MSRFTFEALFPDGSPRRYAGLHRPPLRPGADWLGAKTHQDGVYDVPLYHVEPDEATEAKPSPRALELPTPPDRDDEISQSALALLWATARENHVTEERLRDIVEHVTGQRSTKAIPWRKFDEVLGALRWEIERT